MDNIPRRDKVIHICIAYEQGVGKGRDHVITISDNPYCMEGNHNEDCYDAWTYGYSEGERWFENRKKNE